MNNRVSVVIPAFNGSAFISDSVQSTWRQTRPADEIVVVDDRSTDGTRALVKALIGHSPVPMRLIELPRNSGGPSLPLNTGIQSAKGDVLLLLDQDDLMLPTRIERQTNALGVFPQASISIGRFSIIGRKEGDFSPIWPVSQFHELEDQIGSGREASLIEPEVAFRPLLNRNYSASTSSFAFTRDWWKKIGPFDEDVCTCVDLDFLLRAVSAGPIVIVNERIFEYRWDSASLQRRNVMKSSLEATIVRLRAASKKPNWAATEIDDLRYAALLLAIRSIRNGNFGAARSLAEVMVRHKGFAALRNSLKKRRRNWRRAKGEWS